MRTYGEIILDEVNVKDLDYIAGSSLVLESGQKLELDSFRRSLNFPG